jgi:RDD family
VPTEAAESSVAGTQLRRTDQSSIDVDRRDASQKPTAEPKLPTWRQRTVTLPPASPRHLVGAALIDAFPILIVYGITFGVAAVLVSKSCEPYHMSQAFTTVCGAHMTASGLAAVVIGLLVAMAYSIWNWGYRKGTTGATIGRAGVQGAK